MTIMGGRVLLRRSRPGETVFEINLPVQGNPAALAGKENVNGDR